VHLADLVQEDRAVVRVLELAQLALLGAGESPLLEAEELALQQLRRERGAVDLDEGSVATRELEDGARNQLLAGSALTAHEHGDVRVGDLLDDLAALAHLAAVAAEKHHLGFRAGASAKLLHLGLQRALLQRLLEGDLQLLHLERLAQEVGGAQAHRLHDGAGLTVAGKHDHRDFGKPLLQLLEGLQAVHPREHHVQRDQIGPGLLQAAQRLLAAGRSENLVALAGNQRLEVITYPRVVIDHEHAKRSSHCGTFSPTIPPPDGGLAGIASSMPREGCGQSRPVSSEVFVCKLLPLVGTS
jgi:hypothetical protein